jgi:hypothetical protein
VWKKARSVGGARAVGGGRVRVFIVEKCGDERWFTTKRKGDAGLLA